MGDDRQRPGRRAVMLAAMAGWTHRLRCRQRLRRPDQDSGACTGQLGIGDLDNEVVKMLDRMPDVGVALTIARPKVDLW